MYILTTECCMDAAHFLAGYQGKCGNIHGHRWRIQISVSGEKLHSDQQNNGMVVDFGRLKEDLKNIVDVFDHMFIVEENTMSDKLTACLEEEGFTMYKVSFRPTAENFAKYFFDKMWELGYQVEEAVVYETPNNCAVYRK